MSGWDASRVAAPRPRSAPSPPVAHDRVVYRGGSERGIVGVTCDTCGLVSRTVHDAVWHYRHAGHAALWREMLGDLEYALQYADTAGVSLARQSVEYAQSDSGPRLVLASTEQDERLAWPEGVVSGLVNRDEHVVDTDGWCDTCGFAVDKGQVFHHALMCVGGRGCGENWWYRALVAEYTRSCSASPEAFTRTRAAAELAVSNHAWTTIQWAPRVVRSDK
jgi:hypothetical protein